MADIKAFLFRIGTPLTAGLFIVSAVSGAALYFGIAQGTFHQMHEVLSMVLLLPFVIHVWRNWKPFLNYFRRAAMPAALALSLIAAGYYAFGGAGSGGRGGNPMQALVGGAQQVSLATLAPLLKLDGPTAAKRLADAGYGPVAETDSLADVAKRSGHDAFELLAVLAKPATPASGTATGS